MSDVVGYEVRDRKAYLTLNRPGRLNAITAGVARRLKELVDRANEDPAVHVLVLQGAYELTAREIGHVLGRSERAINSLLHRARVKAREGLRNDGPQEG